MPFIWTINITKNRKPHQPALFQFDQAPQVEPGDTIIWSNKDTVAHWPGLATDPTFFMSFKIAPHSTSSSFSPSEKGTIAYICSLHPNEGGTIEVTDPVTQAAPLTPAGPATQAAPVTQAAPETGEEE